MTKPSDFEHGPRRVGCIVLLVLTCVAIPAAISIMLAGLCSSLQAIDDAHAVESTAGLIIEHLRRNENQWPSGWDELRDLNMQNDEYFAKLTEQVQVDWNANPAELVKTQPQSEGLPFRVVWLKSGSGVYYEDAEPNQMILDYLRK